LLAHDLSGFISSKIINKRGDANQMIEPPGPLIALRDGGGLARISHEPSSKKPPTLA
jgi:hypothetical protein